MTPRSSGFKSDMATLIEIAWILMGDRTVGQSEGPEVRIRSYPHGNGFFSEVKLVFKEENLWSCLVYVLDDTENFDVLAHAVRRFSDQLDALSSLPGILVPKVMDS